MSHVPGDSVSVGTGGAFVPLSGDAATGTVTVAVSPSSAGWTLRGPGETYETGTGSETFADYPVGVYALYFDDVSGYRTPSTTTGILEEDATLAFDVTYEATVYAGGYSSRPNPAGLFNDVFTHYRPVQTDDEQGGFVITYDEKDAFFGRYSTPSAREVENFSRYIAQIESIVYCKWGSDIQRDDVIRSAKTGKTLRVVAIDTPSEPIYYKLLCEERQELSDAVSAFRDVSG